MKGKMFGILAVIIIVLSCFTVLENNGAQADYTLQFVEAQLTSNNSDQLNPDIYEYGLNNYAVVWQDNRNGNWDIYMYYQKYLGDGKWIVEWDTQITSNSANEVNPKIYDNTIVYQSDRNGNWDIYLYDLTSKVETQVTTDPTDQEYPSIYNNIIVWQDWRNMWFTNPYNTLWEYPGMDIYMYNIDAHTEEALPSAKDACFKPTISGNRVVYVAEDYFISYGMSYYSPFICVYDLATGNEMVMTSNPSSLLPKYSWSPRALSSPALGESVIAWSESAGDVGVMKDNVIWRSSGVSGPASPDIAGNFVAYQGNSNGDWDIYLYDTANKIVYDTTLNALGQQENPAISSDYANFVVYQGNRDGRWHIYLIAFWNGMMSGYPSPIPHTPSDVISNLQNVKWTIADMATSDFAGANDKVRENKRNALLNQVDSALADIEAAVNTQNMNLRSKYLQNALDLLGGFVAKVDGRSQRGIADVPGSGFTPDWVTTYALDSTVWYCLVELQILVGST